MSAKKRREFWVSLLDGRRRELKYRGYERQRVYEVDGEWCCGAGLVVDRIVFPICVRGGRLASWYGVSLSTAGTPVLVADLRPAIPIGPGVTPMIVGYSPAVFVVMSHVIFDEQRVATVKR